MAWSSTTVDVSHMHQSLMCVKGIHVCVSKPVCCFKVSKSFGVGMFCPLRASCKRRWERGLALGMMSLHSNHLTHAWWYTTLCAMSHHVSFLFLNREWNSVAARNGCCVCGVNAFMFSPIAWANTCHNAFTNLHSKVHMVHCDSLDALEPVCWLCTKRNLVQCAMNGCGFCLMAFV